MSNKIERGLQARQDDKDRISNQGAKIYKLHGKIKVNGDGQASATIPFPVTFGSIPAFSFGFHLDEHQIPDGRTFPTVNSGIYSWTKIATGITGVYLYTGCTLTIVTTGNPRFLWFHWHIEGHGYRNPVVSDDLAQDPDLPSAAGGGDTLAHE